MAGFTEQTQVFIEEIHEILSEMETYLLDLEEAPQNIELVDKVFRAVHAIKGIGDMIFFDEIVNFTREIEIVFNLVRDEEIPINKDLINLTLMACDEIRTMISKSTCDKHRGEEITKSFKKIIEKNGQAYQTPGEKFETEEIYEIIQEIENILLNLEKNPYDKESIATLFRAVHTLKGITGMFGLEETASFIHEAETVLSMVRDGDIPITKELMFLILSASDHIKSMIYAAEHNEPFDRGITRAIISYLKNITPEKVENTNTEPNKINTYIIQFVPSPDIMKQIDPIGLISDLNELGECKIRAHSDAIPDLNNYIPDLCYSYWDIELKTSKDESAIKEVFIFVEDGSEINIELLKEEVEKKEISPASIEFIEKISPVEETEEKTLPVQKAEEKISIGRKKKEYEDHKKQQISESLSSIRVPSGKLDGLVDLVGELVTVQARLVQFASEKDEPELISIAEDVERLTNRLRDNTLNIRMLPIGTTFGKFRRLVRDVCKDLGKEIEMITEGADTELDKTVIERLGDPLVHLIRNSMDHGIEYPEERKRLGKSEEGKIKVSASYSGACVLIEIEDDGRGLDREAIYTKGLERGVIIPGAELSDKELFSLIFHPGFSTARKVTNISGRGVGMDVVKRCIDGLRGAIDIESQKGKGTKITLKLPLTLAIIDGLLVGIESEYYVLPLSLVEECIELTREDVKNTHGRHIANVRGQIIPYISLREIFNISTESPSIEQIVICRIGLTRVGFVVDQIIGHHQTVLKNMGRIYRDTKGFSGSTILGDGTVALILDLQELLHESEFEEFNMKQ